MKNIITLSVILAILSCNKKITNEKNSKYDLPSIANYYDVLTKKTNGVFGVTRTTGLYNSETSKVPCELSGIFIADNGNLLKGGSLKINNNSFLPDNNLFYGKGFDFGKTMYGKKANFLMEKPTDFSGITSNNNGYFNKILDSLYIPKALKIIYPIVPLIEQNGLHPIKFGSRFEWEIDPLNQEMGILIGLEYDPKENTSIPNAYSKFIRRGEVVPDNGKYIFSEKMFVNIPTNARVLIHISRANYKIFTDKDNQVFTLLAHDTKSEWFNVVR